MVVSVTTDGFITNVDQLESKISGNFLFKEFKKIRKLLSCDDTGLELKSSGVGIVAWSTRGQLGFESKIIATTGFQNKFYNKQDLIEVFLQTFKTEHKSVEFIQSRLRSATEIYKKGGHVTMQYRDQIFRLHFDNRRVLKWETTIPSTCEVLIDSLPLKNVIQGEGLRYINGMYKKKPYGKYTSGGFGVKAYSNNEEIAVRNFVKGLFTEPPMFNLPKDAFYSRRDVELFIKEYNPEIKISETSISLYKNRNVKLLKVQKTKETEAFMSYVKTKFKDFDVDSFY